MEVERVLALVGMLALIILLLSRITITVLIQTVCCSFGINLELTVLPFLTAGRRSVSCVGLNEHYLKFSLDLAAETRSEEGRVNLSKRRVVEEKEVEENL